MWIFLKPSDKKVPSSLVKSNVLVNEKCYNLKQHVSGKKTP